jgi:hypothetical protein
VGTSKVAAPFRVERPGGDLEVHDLTGPADTGTDGGTPALVLAAHGITANALSWQPVADEVSRRSGPTAVRFLAPDPGGAPAAGDCRAVGASARTSTT